MSPTLGCAHHAASDAEALYDAPRRTAAARDRRSRPVRAHLVRLRLRDRPLYTPARAPTTVTARSTCSPPWSSPPRPGSGTFVASLSNSDTREPRDRRRAGARDRRTTLTSTSSSRSRSRPAALVNLAERRPASRSPATSRPATSSRMSLTSTTASTSRWTCPSSTNSGDYADLDGASAPEQCEPEEPAEHRSAEHDPRRRPMTYTLVLLRHGESDWNAKNLFTGWVDVDLTDKGRAEAVRGGELLVDGRAAARRRAHLAAAARDHHRAPRPRRRRPALDPGAALLAAQRAPLRRAPGQGQEADPRGVRRGAVHALAPLVRRAAAAARRRQRVLPGRRPALRRPRRRPAAHRVPQGRHRPVPALLGVRRSSPTCGPARPCWSPPTATACARWSSTSTGSATRTSPGSTSPPACRWSTGSTTTLAPTVPGGEYLDPEAAAAAAAPSRTRVAETLTLDAATCSPVTTKTTRLATETAWSAIRS